MPAPQAAPAPGHSSAQPAPAAGALETALRKAKATGKPVPVEELTTETSLTVALPTGKLALTSHLLPARVKKGGAWADVDATLLRGADGTFAPKATPSGVTVSGGGTGPLATLTDRQGRGLALTFPVSLPAPAVDGDTAVYAEVLPGVDLRVEVGDQGSVREVLVVKNATAAANPALRSLRFGTATKNLVVSDDGHGNISAAPAGGAPVFQASAPIMWDSASEAPAPSPAPVRAAVKAAAGTSSAAGAPSAGAGSASSTDAPGAGAHVKPIGVSVDSSALTLTPDADLLAGKDTVWPLYIDPTFQPTPAMGTNHFAQVMSASECANVSTYDKPQSNGQGVGFQHYERPNCYGMERSYFEFDTSGVTREMYIAEANMYVTESYGAAHDCNATAPVWLKWTGGIDGATTWNRQPDIYRHLGDAMWPKSAYGGCGAQQIVFPVTNELREVAQQGIQRWTVGLIGDENTSTDVNHFMRVFPNPYIMATYDIAPYTPSDIDISPRPRNPDSECGNDQTGWIGQTVPLPDGTSDIWLKAWARTPMPGTNIAVNFHIWDNMTAGENGAPAGGIWRASQPIPPGGGWGQVNLGFQAQDGHQYVWDVRSSDGVLESPPTGFCYFNVDRSAPTLANIAPSSVFPPLGSGIKPTGHAGDPGLAIRVTSTDPVPGGCTRGSCIASGVEGFQYALDDTSSPSGYASQPAGGVTADGSAYADIPISLNRDNWGVHRLYVRAVDRAGNSQPDWAVYEFYAPWNPATKPVAGDVTGDDVPDYLVPASDGSLGLLAGNSDFTAQPGTASTREASPRRDSWNNYLLAHRGSFTGNSVDDLIVYDKAEKQLFYYVNDAAMVPQGVTGHYTQVPIQIGTTAGVCSRGIDGTWQNITQMTAVKTANDTGQPYLVTIEKGQLLYYAPGGAGDCRFQGGVKLGAADDWSGFTLLYPGAVNGEPALWVRDSVTGAVTSLPLPIDSTGTLKPGFTPLATPARQPLVSALKDANGRSMCADIDHGWTANGTAAQLWDCAEGDRGNQRFTLGTDGSLHVLGKCLDVTGGNTENGSPVNLWDCNNSPAQKWVPVPNSSLLKNPKSGKCLDVPRADATAGNHLGIWECHDGASEQWTVPTAHTALPLGFASDVFTNVDSAGDINADGYPDLNVTVFDGRVIQYLGSTPDGGVPQFGAAQEISGARPVSYNINSARNPSRCLDSYGAPDSGPLGFYDCWSGTNQKFTFASDSTLRTGGKCVTVRDDRTDWGAPAAIETCRGSRGQVWTYRGDGTLYNPASNACLELPGWNDANGTVLGIWQCTHDSSGAADANQRWSIYPNTA
ncbi:ricin-type beta-trefoil lectin domain protein [Kitasatospora sp. NPDC005748]|uniref:ricin-type beta-trefoil lectin domain protein n=1 Tax=Kitasatospora sp. NPDC005748 TaxID=3157063 RepID=UPI0033F3385A